MQFNQTYVHEEASVEVNKHMEQIYYSQVLLQNCSLFTDWPAAWETLLQSEGEQMQFNRTYVPDKSLARVNTPMEHIQNSHVVLQSCSAIPDCTAYLDTLLNRKSVEMQVNQTYFPDKALVQVNTPTEQIHYNQVVLENCSASSDCPASLGNTLKKQSGGKFQQDTDLTMSNMYFKGHRSSGMPLPNRKERNRERERKRQRRLREAFNVLRSVIPDYFSEREPGDRLSRIQTLRLAKKYIASLNELLETS